MSSNIEMDKVQKMQAILKDNFQATMDSFLNDSENYISEIEQQIKSGDLKKAQEAAHKLKSSAGLFGLKEVNKLAERIEREAHNADDMKALLSELQDNFKQGKKALKSLE